MVPESAADENAVLYRPKDFPRRWEPVRTLLEGKGYGDTSLFFRDGIYYIVTYFARDLLIFYTTDLLKGEIIAHPSNPVKIPAGHARGAGRVFEYKGVLYRPVQDGREFYGEKVHLMRIDEATPERYVETVAQEDFIQGSLIEGRLGWDAKIHHYDVLKIREDMWLCAFDGTGILR